MFTFAQDLYICLSKNLHHDKIHLKYRYASQLSFFRTFFQFFRAENDGKLYVKYQVIGKNNVAVPTHFFKVILCDKNDGTFDLLSFVMPNQELPENIDLNKYVVPVESIERAAGFLLFERIPESKVKKVYKLL